MSQVQMQSLDRHIQMDLCIVVSGDGQPRPRPRLAPVSPLLGPLQSASPQSHAVLRWGRAKAGDTCVGEAVQRRDLLGISSAATALDAMRLLRTEGVNHVLVMRSRLVAGILCACDLWSVEPTSLVGRIASQRMITIVPSMSLQSAASLMKSTAVGCLPVTEKACVTGILTRGDLHRCGFPPSATGAVCENCGSYRHVRKRFHRNGAQPDSRWCLECTERANSVPTDDPFVDLGGEA